MNRFKVVPGKEEAFEKLWRKRDSHLHKVDGFEKFNLVKGAKFEEYTLYASHTVWKSIECFDDWTKSSYFREAHKNAGKNSQLYFGHPIFEGFEIVL